MGARTRAGLALGLALALSACTAKTAKNELFPDAGPAAPDGGSPASDGGVLAGSFVDLTASLEASPFTFPGNGEPVPPPGAGGFADLDGDGTDEVLLTSREGTVAYRVEGARLVALPMRESNLAAAMDLDGDGRVDLVRAGGPNPLGWGRGDGFFDSAPLGDPTMGRDSISFGAVEDLDEDGWLDLLGGADCCREDVACTSFLPFLRTGPRTFEPRPDLVETGPRQRPTALLAWRAAGGLVVASLGDACEQGRGLAPAVFFRVSGMLEDGAPRLASFDPLPRDAFFRRGLPETNPGYAFATRVPMGGAVGDLDGDGLADLAVTVDPEHAFFSGVPQFPLVDRTPQVSFAQLRTPTGRFLKGWGVALVDLDQDGLPDVVTAHGNDAAGFSDPLVDMGPVPATLHLNGGGWAFTESPRNLGLSRAGQWEALVVGDLDRDGDADLVVGGQGELPRVYRNELVTGHHGLSIRLHGTTSNVVGAGAKVWVRAAGEAQERLHVATGSGSPYWISEPLVFAGLGAATSADVRIEWPSGVEQRVTLAAGKRHDVVEPEVLAVEPGERHVPADGTSQAVLVVSPRDSGGNVIAGRTVAVQSEGAAVAIGAPEVQADGRVRVRVTAPAAAGWTRFRVSIDGREIGVRPRIWWTAR